jgi:hypothetical protein
VTIIIILTSPKKKFHLKETWRVCSSKFFFLTTQNYNKYTEPPHSISHGTHAFFPVQYFSGECLALVYSTSFPCDTEIIWFPAFFH